ncbi:hypothetical protein EGW08_005287 [Elysia chlorotica]|uniref:Uncharacterized protein n=1 Tax=Elysia chlorotica TaxID=188477 RepID=A0A433TZG6_ELYCH|nr:hypothetical protein EGW08_005287 [Elysia chlorotica]
MRRLGGRMKRDEKIQIWKTEQVQVPDSYSLACTVQFGCIVAATSKIGGARSRFQSRGNMKNYIHIIIPGWKKRSFILCESLLGLKKSSIQRLEPRSEVHVPTLVAGIALTRTVQEERCLHHGPPAQSSVLAPPSWTSCLPRVRCSGLHHGPPAQSSVLGPPSWTSCPEFGARSSIMDLLPRVRCSDLHHGPPAQSSVLGPPSWTSCPEADARASIMDLLPRVRCSCLHHGPPAQRLVLAPPPWTSCPEADARVSIMDLLPRG